MSINGALQIGQSAILASQAAIQIAGNNMANAATPGYNRQVARLSPSRPEYIGRAGSGVDNVDLPAATRKGVVRGPAPSLPPLPAAELSRRIIATKNLCLLIDLFASQLRMTTTKHGNTR